MTGDEEIDRDARVTRAGRRRTVSPEVAAEHEIADQRGTSATQVGRRTPHTPLAEPPDAVPVGQEDRAGSETQLGRRRTPTTAGTGTQLGRRVPTGANDAAPDDDGVIRFGPGVPRGPASPPEWSRPTVGPRPRRRPWIGALITVALVAGVIAWLLTHDADPIQARAAQVAAASPAGACNTDVDVVGTITTNGQPGSITYQWTRNDGQPTDVLTQSVASGATSTQVHLHWSFSGHGRFDAVATLRVLDPAPASEADTAFTYSCA